MLRNLCYNLCRMICFNVRIGAIRSDKIRKFLEKNAGLRMHCVQIERHVLDLGL